VLLNPEALNEGLCQVVAYLLEIKSMYVVVWASLIDGPSCSTTKELGTESLGFLKNHESCEMLLE